MNYFVECICEESLCEILWVFFVQYFESVFYQILFMSVLLSGVYEGSIIIVDLLKYGDFGFGIFNELDGELIVFSSQVYQLCVDGSVCKVQLEQKMLFVVMIWFQLQYWKIFDYLVSCQQLYEVIDQ